MFRTVCLVRNQLIKNTVRRSFRSHVIRGLSTECVRRRHHQRAVTCSTIKPILWRDELIRTYSSLPKHSRITLPALSPTMESGSIVSWAKKEGEKLNEGDLLAEIETDKATMGFETPEEGYLAKILVAAGTKDVPIGKLVCIIVENESDVAAFKDFKDDGAGAPAKAAPPKAASPPPAAPAPAAPAAPKESSPPPRPAPPPAAAAAPSGERVYASPMAKKLAEMRNIRLQGKGSGVYGSLTSADLAGLPAGGSGAPAAAAPAAGPQISFPTSRATVGGAPYTDIPITTVRNVIAKRLLQSKNTIPHYYVSIDCHIDNVSNLREKINKDLAKQKIKISMNDFVIKAVATACRRVPDVNAAWMDTVIRQFNTVDVSVAVSTDKGLITPIVFGADIKGLVEISETVKTLAAKARANKLQPQEFQGGSISVSNLGMFDVTQFCAIINPPQAAILAIGGTQHRIIPSKSPPGFQAAQFMTVTLSADHRVVDGAVAATWLKAFRESIENPATMLL